MSQILTDAEIAEFEERIRTRKVTKPSSHPALEAAEEWFDACWSMNSAKFQTRAYYEAFFEADAAWEKMAAAVAASAPVASPVDARPVHPNHRPDLRYVRKVLDDVRTLALVEGDKLCGDVDAAVNGMDYIIKRTEEAASTTPEPSPLVAPRWMPIESETKEPGNAKQN